jgi:hypothetical protein
MIFGLTGLAVVAITATVLTAVVQICNIVRKDKQYQKRINKK